jgi:hypothetical protein
LTDAKHAILFGCGGMAAIAVVLCIALGIVILRIELEPESEKATEYAESFVDSDVISPRPATMTLYKTLDFHEGNIAGDADSCIAAYTLRPEDFDLILKAHKWRIPSSSSSQWAIEEFRKAWPEYTGDIDSYYWDDGDEHADLSGRSTLVAVSKDHTKLVFDTADAWARPFEPK